MKGLVLALIPLLAQGGFAGPRPDLVERVASGGITEAHVSWWGYDPEDSTEFIVAALRSAAPTVILDRVDGAWNARPMEMPSNRTLVIPEDVELVARRGAFKGTNDILLRFWCASNVVMTGGGTVRMWLEDYTNATLYAWSEHRHALSLESCAGIRIENLTITGAGGDGIYLGEVTGRGPNRDIVIRDVRLTRNNRQAMSVIAADGLLMERVVMEGTCGTPPMAGIDFEPNFETQSMRGVVLRDCIARGNLGSGYNFSLGNLNALAPEVSIALENCRSEGNVQPIVFQHAPNLIRGYRGSIAFTGCTFDDRDRTLEPFKPTFLSWIPGSSYSVTFTDSWAANPETGVLEPLGAGFGWPSSAITDAPDGSPLDIVPFGRTTLGAQTVHDRAPGRTVPLSPVGLREQVCVLVYADRPRRIRLGGVVRRIGTYDYAPCSAAVRKAGDSWRYGSGEVVDRISDASGFDRPFDAGFTAPDAGFYRLDFTFGANLLVLTECDAPVAVVPPENRTVPVLMGGGPLYLDLPQGTPDFVLAASALGSKADVSLSDPVGSVVAQNADVGNDTWLWEPADGTAAGIWTVRVEAVPGTYFGTYRLDAFGVPACFFLSPVKTWCACRPEDEDVVIPSEGLTVDVPAGETLVWSGRVTGPGILTKTGGGTLALGNSGNAFSGTYGGVATAVRVREGCVRADADGCFGTAAVVAEGTGRIQFNSAGADFGNRLIRSSTSDILVEALRDVTLSGDIGSWSQAAAYAVVPSGVTLRLKGVITNRKEFLIQAGGTVVFDGPFDGNLSTWQTGFSGTNVLANAGNAFGTIGFGGMRYVCAATNVLNGATLLLKERDSPNNVLDLNGCDQSVAGFSYESGGRAWSGNVGGRILSERPATLTVRGRGADVTDEVKFEIDGAVSVVLDADPGYTARFIDRANRTTGSIEVRSGTLSLAGTDSGTSFRNLSGLSVSRGAELAVERDPASLFTAARVRVSLETGSRLVLPADSTFTAVSLRIDGVRQPVGEYTAANCPAIVSGRLVVPDISVEWTGAVADGLVSRPQNWRSQESFDLSEDPVFASFAVDGGRAVFDLPVFFTGVRFDALSFAFAAAGGGVRVGADGIMVSEAVGGTPRRFDFDVPIALTADQVWDVPAGATLAVRGMDSPEATSVRKTGAGTLEFSGVNVFGGKLTVEEGATEISGLLTAPDGPVDVDPARAIPADQMLTLSRDARLALRLKGATIDMPLRFGHQRGDYGSFTVVADTTNVFRSALLNANISSQGLTLESGSMLICSGGVQHVSSFYVFGNGTWCIRKKPLRWYSSDVGKFICLDRGSGLGEVPRMVFEATGNLHNFRIGGQGGEYDCRVDDAFAAGATFEMSLSAGGRGTLQLNATAQCFDRVVIGSAGLGEVSGSEGAVLGVRGADESEISAQISGVVSIEQRGTGTLYLRNRDFASSGAVRVFAGRVVFDGATWRNGLEVRVAGTGRLELPAASVFSGDAARLTLEDDGQISIPDGAVAEFKEIRVDGKLLAPGFYTPDTAPAALRRHLAGTGSLRAADHGFVIWLR